MTVEELIEKLRTMPAKDNVTIDAGSYLWTPEAVEVDLYGGVSIICRYGE